MRRKDREVTSIDEIMEILARCKVCRLGLADHGKPYVVPVNFGAQLEDGQICIYIHGAKAGRKLDILRENPLICVEADCGHRLLEGEIACAHSYAYESVIGFGKAEVLQGHQEKAKGLEAIHRNVTGKRFAYTPEQTETVAVLRVALEEASGKRRA